VLDLSRIALRSIRGYMARYLFGSRSKVGIPSGI